MPKELARAVTKLFSRYLLEFSRTWHNAWNDLGCERACVAKVAEALSNKFSGNVEAWCEINKTYVYEKFGKSLSGSPVDLVLTHPHSASVLALVEFKTNSGIYADMEKLETLQNDLTIGVVISVGCQWARIDTGEQDNADKSLRHFLDRSKQDVIERGWMFEECPSLVIGTGSNANLIGTFAAWRAKPLAGEDGLVG
jgi:hypothetical protein